MTANTAPADSSKRGYALITGASSGIGRALALEFASRGYDLVLVARNESALGEIAALCQTQHRVLARSLSCDLAAADAGARIQEWLNRENLKVDVLVNNAGFTEHGRFLTTDLSHETSMVQVQIQATLELTKRLLPGMVERRRGGILNVASVYCVSPVPEQAVYGACKAFLLSFSEALAKELEGTGVQITTVCPGVTRTEFRRRAGMREKSASSGLFPVMSAEDVAIHSLDAFEKKERIAVPGLPNKLFVHGCRLIPMTWVSSVVSRINGIRGIQQQET